MLALSKLSEFFFSFFYQHTLRWDSFCLSVMLGLLNDDGFDMPFGHLRLNVRDLDTHSPLPCDMMSKAFLLVSVLERLLEQN